MSNKSILRQLAHEQRASIPKTMVDEAAQRITLSLVGYINSLPSAKTIAGYLPIKDELDIIPVLATLARENYQTALPVITNTHQPLEFYPWVSGEETQPSRVFPRVDEPVMRDVQVFPDVVLVPLLGFDSKGHRLGYGGGFYDRTLHQLRGLDKKVTAIGVAYEAQRIADIPTESTDQCLDVIITESQCYQF